MASKTPRARTTDPETSQQTTMDWSPDKLRASQARVLNMFALYGDLHDKALVEYLNAAERSAGLRPMSPSGARSRRSELAKPNMERLDELIVRWFEESRQGVSIYSAGTTTAKVEAIREFLDVQEWAACVNWSRTELRREGFRSKLWDTGRRQLVDGHNVIVWGLAK